MLSAFLPGPSHRGSGETGAVLWSSLGPRVTVTPTVERPAPGGPPSRATGRIVLPQGCRDSQWGQDQACWCWVFSLKTVALWAPSSGMSLGLGGLSRAEGGAGPQDRE